jgi:hypothetical protein
MTDTFERPDLLGQLRQLGRSFGGIVGKLGFGLLVVVAVIVALLATTFIGVLLALAALFLTLTRKRPGAASGASADGTLDARPTADGWVIVSPRAQ